MPGSGVQSRGFDPAGGPPDPEKSKLAIAKFVVVETFIKTARGEGVVKVSNNHKKAYHDG